ncbi:MAG: hypothetical protein L6R40_006024 [Gallowayella cf. fulva]|nr:MAG: hypothetical protein L6R40_006024 [Xanthomendoza cf. fulva]
MPQEVQLRRGYHPHCYHPRSSSPSHHPDLAAPASSPELLPQAPEAHRLSMNGFPFQTACWPAGARKMVLAVENKHLTVSLTFTHFLSNISTTLPSSILPASAPHSPPFSILLSSLFSSNPLFTFPHPFPHPFPPSSSPPTDIPSCFLAPLNHAIAFPVSPPNSSSTPKNLHAFALAVFLKSCVYSMISSSSFIPPPLVDEDDDDENKTSALPACSPAAIHNLANRCALTFGISGALTIHSLSVASAIANAANASCTPGSISGGFTPLSPSPATKLISAHNFELLGLRKGFPAGTIANVVMTKTISASIPLHLTRPFVALGPANFVGSFRSSVAAKTDFHSLSTSCLRTMSSSSPLTLFPSRLFERAKR